MRRGLRVGRSRRRDTSVVGRIDGHRQGAAGPPGRAVRRVLAAGRASAVLRKSTHQRSWASAGRAVAGGGARRADELVRGSQARGAPRCRRAASRAGTGCASPGRGRVAATVSGGGAGRAARGRAPCAPCRGVCSRSGWIKRAIERSPGSRRGRTGRTCWVVARRCRLRPQRGSKALSIE